MEVVTFSAIKGGVGKTTLAFNYGEWLADQGKKVLFMDLDHQCNLTQSYGLNTTENTIANAFSQDKREQVDIYQVKPNIGLIAGYLRLDQVETELENRENKSMRLYMWIRDFYETKNMNQYDYLIVDCHPDFSIATKNAIAMSDTVFSPIVPSKDDYDAKFNLSKRLEIFKNEMINFDTRESYITAKLYFIGNKVKHNTNSSKEFLRAIANEENVITVMPNKELINTGRVENKSITAMKKEQKTYQKHKEFFAEADKVFETMTEYA
ncbi:MAG: AAA family ATPase [Tetragenococcus koreensis]|nr:AAA family ATPase [Tetragenococcus koreensis]MDN6750877.1 AAA family ATPase [Staphylococcus equorum]MDN6166906.1 AAA family ATPase [Tetragenococcus koreensis]MDN6268558.1 AAA family ATPase [Tetragenococcus koreensis]MDN6502012.1 AAA family ATPase [Tetragenococcus koreensis]